MVRKLNNKQGGIMILIVILSALLFPIIMSGIIDLTNIYKIDKQLKTSLNAATKSASSRIDWSAVPDGVFRIDEPVARNVFLDILNKNLGVSAQPVNNYYHAVSANTGNSVSAYVTIYNNRHTGTFVSFPADGSMPTQAAPAHVGVQVDRPTVVGVATAYMKLSPLFGGKTIRLMQIASSQLNMLPPLKQESGDLLFGSWYTFMYGGALSSYEMFDSGGYDNGKYMRIYGTGSGDSGAGIYVPNIKPNTDYSFSAMVKIPNGGTSHGNGLLFMVSKSDSVGVARANPATSEPNGTLPEWTEVKGTFNSGSDDAMRFRICRGDFPQILVSDVRITEKP